MQTAYPINQTTQASTYESLIYIQGEKRLPTEPPLLRVQTLAVESLSWFCLFRTNDVFPHEFKWPYRLSRDNCCFAKNAAIYIISRDPETLVTLRIVMNASLKFYSLILKHSPDLRTNFQPIRSFLNCCCLFHQNNLICYILLCKNQKLISNSSNGFTNFL